MGSNIRVAGVAVLAMALAAIGPGGGARAQDGGVAGAASASASSGAGAIESISGFHAGLAEGVADDPDLSAFYAEREFQPIWTSAADADRRAAFFAALDQAGAQGLPVARYGADQLRARFDAVADERSRGLLEAAMSRAFLTWARDASTGALTPKRIDPTIVRAIPRRDRLELIYGFAQTPAPAAFLEALQPSDPHYVQLLRARLDLARQIRNGGWGRPVPDAQTLRPGDAGPAVTALRDRLIRMGYLSRSVSARYDAAMVTAVKAFQADMGEKVDGVAGAATLAALNVAPEDRMKSILVAMERLRWMNGLDLGRRYIWVNIPDYHVQIIENGAPTYDSVTVVGQAAPDRRTPEFSDMMQMMVINPSWHVPRSITVKEYLPKMQRNPNAASQIAIVDRSGQIVPRDQIDFAAYTPDNFPFRMKQFPSDDNALGAVKFLFPNPWNIYLHDTPSKSLFTKPERAFSHGCVRVGRPFDLAYALLAGQADDPVSYFQDILKSGKETTVRLQNPVPVHLVYFTAWPAARGRIEYRDDVYGRDAALYAALAQGGVELTPVTD